MESLQLPLIDVSALVNTSSEEEFKSCAELIDQACRQSGFFRIKGHGVPMELQAKLDSLSREFFSLPEAEKAKISMSVGGSAWRGWFPVGGELTSGKPDRKEGLYVGQELPNDHSKVIAKVPLHGRNLYPSSPADLGPTVNTWF
jgi:isopenicillin N synthase-like dioxygenase